MLIDDIKAKLNSYIKSDVYVKHLKNEEKDQKSLDDFLTTFTETKIATMSIDEYVFGKNKRSFCEWVEKSVGFGSINARTTWYQKFVIYWNKEKGDYSFGSDKVKRRKGFGSTKEEIFENVKKHLLDLIDATKNNDDKRIELNPLNPLFKNKISFIYDSKNQIPIFSNNHLNTILTIFDIPFNKNEDRIYKRRKLFSFYKENGFDTLVKTPNLFTTFIYSWFGYGSEINAKEKPTIDVKTINSYSLIDIQIKEVISSARSETGTKHKINYDPGTEESKRITGRKAEDIVWEYLHAHADELDAHHITSYCFGEKHDDGKGYDFSYEQSDGTQIFVEVKGTKADLKDKVVFEMSANEYNVMKKHLDTYYIFFVNDVNSSTIIQRILASDISGEEPTKYRISFKSKKK